MDELQDLLKRLEDPDRAAYEMVEKEIGRFGEAAIDPLVTMLENPNALLRVRAADLLCHLAWNEVVDKQSVAPLVKCLTDKDLPVRTSAVWALARIAGA